MQIALIIMYRGNTTAFIPLLPIYSLFRMFILYRILKATTHTMLNFTGVPINYYAHD